MKLSYYTLVYTAAAPAPVSQPPKEAGQGRPLQAYRCAPQRAGAYMPRTRAQTTIPFTKPETPNLQSQQPAADSYIITSASPSHHRSPSHSHPAAAILESNTFPRLKNKIGASFS